MMKEWNDYLASIKEADSFKNRIRSYISDRDEMLKKGGNKNTSPYTQKMSNHVTFDQQLKEITVDAEGFRIHDTLESQIWQDEKLNPEIRDRLLKIANEFIEGLPVDVDIEDVTLTGSLANYNWSEYSDIDIHIVVDFSKINNDEELVKSFFDAHRLRWNDKHDIRIHNFEVEIYVENTGEEHRSSGIYSLLENKWIIEPSQVAVEIDYETAKKKSDDYMSQMKMVVNMIHGDKDYERALRNIERIKTKIRTMRQAGLTSKAQEYSAENIAFKILRRENILRKLNDLRYLAYDSSMSIEEENDGV